MFNDRIVESLLGKTTQKKKSRIPARLDFLQSATGLFLAIFMIFHMLFVSSILISKDFMFSVTKAFELSFLFEGGSSIPVFITILVVFVIFIFHAFLALRKFPISYKEALRLKTHSDLMKHSDTKLWIIQVVTGFALFFLGSVHLYIMLTNPGNIGPYASSDRVYSDMMWPLYIMLLAAVEFHGAIGLYRLSVKWGWFEGDDPKKSRARLKKAKWILSGVMLTLGVATLIAYMKIGAEHQANYGERYTPQVEVQNAN
ncbi:MAG: fumarate reductase cytochrome b subunit [Sulfurovum sp.]|nr:fumarate reductase cytochrome b subunit [Sulfurovum sp.]MBT8348800.1 fumarate reductase cytochrome b subunit [Sulfurovum sp.]NNJ45368.1 fumarate reductase cytochrome b subunit [Sulfurovum sp.]